MTFTHLAQLAGAILLGLAFALLLVALRGHDGPGEWL